jgi:transcriptional regulator with XRE-family HTH domain
MKSKLARLDKTDLLVKMGTRLRELRRSYGITIEDLAEQIMVTPGYLGLIERGKRGITAERLIYICTLFQCSADYILTGDEKDDTITKPGELAVAIDLLLNDDAKQKFYELLKAL